MNIDRLRLFLKIVEAGSMMAASRAVHLTQPALSRNLALLEEEIGTSLFERRGRGLQITAAGRALVPRAKRLLFEADSLGREVSRIAARNYFDLRLGTIDSVATYLLPNVLEGLSKEFAGLSVKLSVARSASLLQKLRSGELDVGIIAHSGSPPELTSRRVGPYNLEFYGRRDRFPALAEVRKASDLHKFPMVEIEPPPGQPSVIPDAAYSYAVATTIASVKALVLSGFGVGDLVHFVLSPAERKSLVKAVIAHDPDCALFVVVGANWKGSTEKRIASELSKRLGRAV